ncbi:hypothetical protein ACKWTF_016039 [Chironomus riparius]
MKLIFSILLAAAFAYLVISQTDPSVNCVYQNHTLGYTCYLNTFNPDGIDNFTKIDGEHLKGKIHMDVRRVMSSNTSTTTIIPSILCNSFRFSDHLSIINSFIGYVGPNALRSCSVLTILNLSNNKITDLAPNAFENTRFLRNLILDLNYLMDLPDGVFKPLIHLQNLQINQNFLQVIQTAVFSSHPVLENVFLNYNMILALSPAIIENTNIQTLYMNSNICANGYFYNLSRENLTISLQKCLDNYSAMQISTTPLPTPPPGSCGVGNIYDRVCELESIVEELSQRIDNLTPDPHK